MRSPFHCLSLNLADSGKLVHEIRLCRQSSCSIHHHKVYAFLAAGSNGVIGDRSRVALFLRNHFNLIALAPDSQLFSCCCSESIRCCQQDFFIQLGKMLR